ncbi:MAG: hypothetical protein CMD49_01000 [Gammaproteobacteria bacterium]|nr:hypothetical protein [Gammaproteobacteria bacterium]
MAIRIKSKWSKTSSKTKTSEDIASALSFIAWKLSLDKARNLHGEDFEYSSDHQRVTVIVEFMSFQIHLVDRLLFLDKTTDDERIAIMNNLGKQSARIMQENCEELFGLGDYKKGYINTLNMRSSEYSEFKFSKKESNYSIFRHLAKKIQDAMGLSQTNKWVMDQIVDIDSVEVYKKIIEVYDSLRKSG